jgi:RNA polymerase sigma factor (sigma-70 family)
MMTGPETDAAILAASRGEPSRFAEIFDRHFDAIYSYLRRRLGGQLAEDLTADVFEHAFRARARYDSSSESAKPWLYGIAANLMRHHRRQERRRLRAYARSSTDAVVQDETDAAASRMDAEASAPHVALALAGLQARDRETLLLFIWGELSYSEIAEALGLPVGTVRSRLYRGRTRVRELLGSSGQYEGADDETTRRTRP